MLSPTYPPNADSLSWEAPWSGACHAFIKVNGYHAQGSPLELSMSPEGLRHAHGTLGLTPGSDLGGGAIGANRMQTSTQMPHSPYMPTAGSRASSTTPPLVTPGGTYVWRLPPSRPVTSAVTPPVDDDSEEEDDEDPLLSDAEIERELAEMARRTLLSDLGIDDDDDLAA